MAGDCWFNGPITYVPPQTAAQLPALVMTATAGAGQDTVTLATTSGMYVCVAERAQSVGKSGLWSGVQHFRRLLFSADQFHQPDGSRRQDKHKRRDHECPLLAWPRRRHDGRDEQPQLRADSGAGLLSLRRSVAFDRVHGGHDTAHTHKARCAPTPIEGDPHITTVDGAHYDFQGAESSSRCAIPTDSKSRRARHPSRPRFSGPRHAYDGLATCVSLNTAVAARVGSTASPTSPTSAACRIPTASSSASTGC